MALRSSEQIGVRDPRRIQPVLLDDGRATSQQSSRSLEAPSADVKPPQRRPQARPSPRSKSTPARRPAVESDSAPADRRLRDEPTDYVQVSVPGDLQQRMETVCFELSERHPKLAKHQLVVGALLWRYVDYRDEAKMRHLSELVEAYWTSELAEAPLSRRLAARVPVSLKRQARGAALRLRQTHEEASLRLLVSALVDRYVRGPDDPRTHELLIATLREYREALRV